MLVGSVTCFEEIEKVGPLVDLVEIRLDHFDLLEKPPFPCIFTFRKKEQGGAKDISEKTRLNLIEKYLELGPEYCDLEADTDPAFLERMAKKFPQVKWIGSYHNFQKTPADLDALLQSMKHPCFSLYKMALQAQSTADMLRLMLFLKNTKEPLCAISMGEFGKPSRIIAKVMGSQLDYAGLVEDPQLHRYSLQTLLEVFHYRALNPNTRLYALIGDPVEKSPGHLFHNPRFSHNAVYVKMIVRKEEISEVFALIRQLPFGGLSVTMPLKEAVITEMDEIAPMAQEIGAVNTVVFKEGKAIGSNTDAPGALDALEEHVSVQGKTVAILGAGGAARAIIYEAMRRGATVSVFSRTKAKGFGLEELASVPYDILINTIPPVTQEVPPLRKGTVVMDVVIAPKETPLLRKAKEMGCFCVYGEEMFVEQALLQQQTWRM